MQMNPVVSSNVAAIGYEPESQTLAVQFNSGRTYHYQPVPQSTFDNFMSAGSKGQYFNTHIKDVYGEV